MLAYRQEYKFYRNLICHKKIILARFYHAYLNRNLNLLKSTSSIGFHIKAQFVSKSSQIQFKQEGKAEKQKLINLAQNNHV